MGKIPEYRVARNENTATGLVEIDKLLINNIFQPKLWQKRGQISKNLNMKASWLISLMTSATLSKDTSLFSRLCIEYVQNAPTISQIFEENVNETEKGKILSKIRKSHLEAEFQYATLLVFAARFNDFDIFEQAIDSMKTGFTNENRSFFNFSETRLVSADKLNVANKVELLKERDLPRIKVNVRNFLQKLGSCGSLDAIALVRKQFNKLLSFHLSDSTASRICPVREIGRNASNANRVSMAIELFAKMIESWEPNRTYANKVESIRRWGTLLVMDKIKETSLKDFFTGDLYKPPFMFLRQTDNGQPTDFSAIHWMDELDRYTFPLESDGKPLARAVFARFSDNYNDWDEYFKLALESGLKGFLKSRLKNHASLSQYETMAKAQRLLLLMVSEYGPLPEFEKYILPPVIEKENVYETWDIYRLVMYCDMYRLHLAYKKPIDEQALFNLLIKSTPSPTGIEASQVRKQRNQGYSPDMTKSEMEKIRNTTDTGYDSFARSAEWIIMSLLLTSSPVRRFQLDNILRIASQWLKVVVRKGDKKRIAEVLNIITFLEIGTLADLVPEKLEFHQLNEHRKAIWLKHAFNLSSNKQKAWNEWQKACNF